MRIRRKKLIANGTLTENDTFYISTLLGLKKKEPKVDNAEITPTDATPTEKVEEVKMETEE